MVRLSEISPSNHLYLHSTVVLLMVTPEIIEVEYSDENLHSTVVLLMVSPTISLLYRKSKFTFYCSSINGDFFGIA